MKKRSEIRIRDPFVLVDREKGKYYLYGTTALGNGLEAGASMSVYESEDLETFSDPIEVFDGKGCWGTLDYWAPEVHYYRGKYYAFVSMRSEEKPRATQILVSDSPMGRFTPVSDKPATPWDRNCLDGTFWVENGVPYLVYSREWVEIGDGEFYAQRLSDDLTQTVGEPIRLFSASENPLVEPFADRGFEKCYVTDGPFLYLENGQLKMIWSSFVKGHNYCILEATAPSVLGPWKHSEKSVFDQDGGHAMIFTDLTGKRKIAFHQPNIPPSERAKFFDF